MSKLRIYRVKLDYIKYLWDNVDKKVQYNKNASDEYNEKRPYVGLVYKFADIKYFAPLEHPRSSHQNLKTNPHIIKIEDGRYGIIALGNMIPVLDECLIDFDIDQEDDDYKKILKRQFVFCRKNNTRILANAEQTYQNVTVKKIPFFVASCCDFTKLEREYIKYLESGEDIAQETV